MTCVILMSIYCQVKRRYYVVRGVSEKQDI